MMHLNILIDFLQRYIFNFTFDFGIGMWGVNEMVRLSTLIKHIKNDYVNRQMDWIIEAQVMFEMQDASRGSLDY